MEPEEPQPTLFGRAIHFLYVIGLPPMRILQGLVFFLIAGLIFGAIFVSDISNPFKTSGNTDPENDKPIEYVAKPDLAAEALPLDAQIDEIYYFRQDDRINFVVAVGEIEVQRAKAQELLRRTDLSAEQKYKLQFTLLRHGQSVLQRSHLAQALESVEVDRFNEFARSFIGGPDAKLEDFAKFSIADAETLLLLTAPSEENARRLTEVFGETKSSFLNNEKRAQGLYANLTQARRTHPNKPHIEKSISDYGTLLAASEEEQVALLSTRIGDFSRFAPFKINTLESRIRLKVDGSLQDLDNALRALGAAPNTEIGIWKTLIRAYESTISNGQDGVLQTGWGILNDLVGKLPDADEKKEPLKTALAKQLERSKMLGLVLDLKAGETANGRPFSQQVNWQAIVFADRAKKSSQATANLKRRQQEGLQIGKPIIAFKDDYTATDLEQLEDVKNFQLASFETAQKFAETLSIDTYPYVVLVDDQGTVVAINLSVEQAVKRILEHN